MPRPPERTLTLFRHGKSSWDDETLDDHERPLNERGQRDVPEMARRLKAAGIRPSLIVASNAKRTWQTAKLIADALGYPREFLHREQELYLATPNQIAAFLAEQDDRFHSILMCGHNPGLTELAVRLVPGLTDNVPTSGLVTVRSVSADWRTFFAGDVELVRFDTPRQPWINA